MGEEALCGICGLEGASKGEVFGICCIEGDQ